MFQISLKAARVNAGYNTTEAAKLFNVSPMTLRKWEKTPGIVPAFRQAEISKHYNISIDNIKFIPED